MMNSDAELYSHYHGMQDRDAKKLLSCVWPKMNCAQDELVMDIGCGTGDNTWNLLKHLPADTKIVAVDILPSMIEFARAKRPHPNIEYRVADVEQWETISEFEGRISKIFSIYCFNWIKDQPTTFRNMYRLLHAGGDGVFVFALSAELWGFYPEIINDPEWNVYLKGKDSGVPSSHFNNHRSYYYEKLLQDIGFEVCTCEEEDRVFAYASDAHCKESLFSRCGLVPHIPDDLKDRFRDYLFDFSLKRIKRNEDGSLETRYISLTVHVRKPEQCSRTNHF